MPAPPNKKKSPRRGFVVARTTAAQPVDDVSQEEIARLAYSYWEARGGEGGSAEEDWLRAEQELRAPLAPPPRKRVRVKKMTSTGAE